MKVLVVSDDLLFAGLVTKKVVSLGYTTDTVSTGADAYDRIKKDTYRIVLTGWDLSGMSGHQLTENIRQLKRSRYTYIIVCTVDKSADVIVDALEAGADDFLNRPLNPVELTLKMRHASRLLDLEDELHDGAGTDATTGLVNQASFRHFFRVVVAEARRLEERGSLMFVTVDEYKSIFDQHGFEPAEKLAVEIGRALNSLIRSSDLVARFSDDQFCMLLQNTHWDVCRIVAGKVKEKISNMSLFFEDLEIHPEVTVEILNYPVDELSSDGILAITDRITFEP